MDIERACLKKIILLALAEDRVEADVTTNSLLAFDGPARAEVRAKAVGVISGIWVFEKTMLAVDSALQIKVAKADGCSVLPGDLVLEVKGMESSILKGERTTLARALKEADFWMWAPARADSCARFTTRILP